MSGCKMSIIQFFANLLLLIGSIILRKQTEVVAPRSVAGLLCLPRQGELKAALNFLIIAIINFSLKRQGRR